MEKIQYIFIFFVYCRNERNFNSNSMAELEKFTLEYSVKASPKVLYTLISTAEGLSRWFADNVDIEGRDVFNFKWEDSEQSARMVQSKENEYVRFQWLDGLYKDCYFELEIITEPVSSEVALLVTDYSDPDDIDFAKLLWNTQVGLLQRMFNNA